MKRRLFLSIEIPEPVCRQIQKQIQPLESELETAGIRSIPQGNWHLTLIFLDYQEDADVGNIVQAMEAIIPTTIAPDIQFTELSYGPIGKPPRMLWLNGSSATSDSLNLIRSRLEEALVDHRVRFPREHRKFHTHLTLARFPEHLRAVSLVIPQITPIEFVAPCLNLMESHTSREEAEYVLLQSIAFQFESIT